MSVTIKDVAKAAGVSVATVSRVLNNSPAVSEDTADAVNAVIKSLGYSPNFLGRNLRKCETNNILAVIPSTEHTFYSEIIKGMQDAAYPEYDIFLCTSYSSLKAEMRLLEMLFNRTVDAAVLLGTQLNAEQLHELDSKFNIALCSERVENADVLTITIDNEQGAYDAVSEMLKNGLRRIAFVTTKGTALSSYDREIGYTRALMEYGIEKDERYIFRGSYDYTDGCRALERFMSLPEPPEAVFCISDLLAVGVIKEANRRGINVGTELQVHGFDNITLSEMYIPGITTVAQPVYEMGRTVISRLIGNIKGDNVHDTIILPHELVIRGSAGAKK
ncbi:MAG: LacI family DNA-binding transcriptional regulator [Huintestinicola sp.]